MVLNVNPQFLQPASATDPYPGPAKKLGPFAPATPPDYTPDSPTALISAKTICLAVTLHGFGVRRKADAHLVETEADKSMLYLGTDILDSKELKAIETLHGQVKSYLRKNCLPGALLKAGLFLLPIDLLQAADAEIEALRAEEKELVEDFLAVYPQQVEAAKGRLANLFNPAHYPPIEALRAAFGIEVQYLALSVPSSLKEIDAEIWQREREKFDAQWAETLSDIREGMRAGLQKMVDHLVDRLTPGADGKPKRFHASTVENLKEFLDVFDSRNVVGDADLKELVDRAQKLIAGVPPAALKENKSLRETVLKGFQAVQLKLDGLVETGGRRYSLEEE